MTQWKCLHIDKLLYLYRVRDGYENTTFVSNKSIQDHLAIARNFYAARFDEFNKRRLAAAPAVPVDLNKPCFVVASRFDEDAQLIHEQLKGQDLYVAMGCSSIFEAYEAGRKIFAGRKRVVYVHNDVRFADVPGFVELVTRLPKGLHGLVGSNDPEALEKFPWWERQECHGKWKQRHSDGREIVMTMGISDKASEVRYLDGCLLVAIDQAWDWNVRGNPKLWHAYDYMACKKTIDAGDRCFTLTQPGEPILMHFGWGRMEGLFDALKIVRNMMRTAADRRDHPNIHEYLPRLEEFAKGNVLEMGSRDGVSTDAFLRGVEKRGGFVWSVDCDEAWKDAWTGHPQWKFVHAFSTEQEKIFAADVPKELDVVFLDTEHSHELTQKELVLWAPKLKPDGVLMIHDTKEFPELRRAAEEYAKEHGMQAEFLEEATGLGILRPKGAPAPVVKDTVPCPSEAKGPEGPPGVKTDLATKDVSYVIPVAKPGELLTRCLTSIRKWSPESEIIVVANGCTLPPHVEGMIDKVVSLEMNLRFGAGCNRGAMEATRQILAILNDDAEFVDEETPLKLVEAVKNHGGFAAPYSNRAKPPQGDVPRENTPRDSVFVDMVVGVCMMVPTELFRKLNGFDTRLDTYEDDDICHRARDRFGVPSQVVGGTWIKHERHSTFRALGEDVQAVMNRNGMVFRSKHPRIGVIAIAKDEEPCVEGFFKQFLPVTNQFRLLDTGSRDGTLAAAERVGARVESAVFADFSNARNLALERFGKEFDWVIMLDPDERLDEHTIGHIKELVFRTDQDIFLAPLEALYPDGSTRSFVAKPFLFRSNPNLYWVFKVHEKLIGSQWQALVANAVNEHMIKFHEDGRRRQMSGFYRDLQNREPYFADPVYRQKMRDEWPILDYDRMDDPRIKKIWTGPLISVVIPTFKRGELLVRAVKSALAQDYSNVEVVVVGDACPALHPESPDPRVRVINLPKNHGSGGAVPRNYGIMMAAGGLIAYCDDDNAWTPDHLSSLYEEMRKTDAAYAFSSMSVDGKDLKFDVPKPQGIDTSCVLHRKDLILKHGWWRDRIEAGYAHDAEFFSRWKDERWACTKKPTVVYNADTSGQPEFIRALAAKANP